MDKHNPDELEQRFKPVGTIAFIVLLLLLATLIWFSVYNIQLERH